MRIQSGKKSVGTTTATTTTLTKSMKTTTTTTMTATKTAVEGRACERGGGRGKRKRFAEIHPKEKKP